MIKPLFSQRLHLRPVCLEDAHEIFKLFTPNVTRYMYPSHSKSVEESSQYLKGVIESINEDIEYVYAITLKSTQEFIGMIGLHALKSKSPELGIWTGQAFHGHNYGLEAIETVVQYAKELGYSTLIYPVDTRNIASKRIPLSLNGILTKPEENTETQDGRILRIETYTIPL